MRTFVFGATCGAIAMYLYLNGFGPIVWWVESWYLEASRPPASALQR